MDTVLELAVTVVTVTLGAALAFGGLLVYRQGIQVFGGLLGAGLAFFGTAALSGGGATQVVVVLVAGVLGVGIARAVYLAMIAVPGAATGFGLALWATGTSLDPWTNVLDPLVFVAGAAGAVLATVFSTAMVVVVSATWGSLLVWVGLRTQYIVDSLVGLNVPTPRVWTLVFAAVGAAVQATVWYYREHYEDGTVRALLERLRREDGRNEDPASEVEVDTWTEDA